MAKDIFDTLAKEQQSIKGDIFDTLSKDQPYESGIIPAIGRGLKSSATAQLLGYEPERQIENQSFGESVAQQAGEVIGDIPEMIGGGILGGVAGPIGSAAAAFGAPALIKSAAAERRRNIAQPEELTALERLQSLGRVAKETGKAGTIGAATGAAGKLMPLVSKLPGVDKILQTGLGKGLTKAGLELGAMTGTQAALEQKMPETKDIAANALLMGGLHAAGMAPGKIKSAASGIYEMLPEKTKSQIGTIATHAKKPFEKYSDLKQNFYNMAREHVGEKAAKVIESQIDWQARLSKAQEKGEFSKENLEDMIYYRQKTGNPFKEGDTPEMLSNRLPEHAKKFVDDIVVPHLEKSLKHWNEIAKDNQITPREGLENYYLPGLYEFDPEKFARATADVSNTFKKKNPLSNAKTFLTYEQAFKERGLIPKYKTITEMMHAYDNIMSKTEANRNLLQNIKNYEKENQIKLIVRPNDSFYQEAKKQNYVPFDEPLFRVKSKSPALVNPDFADVFQGIFSKDAYKPESKYWRAYDWGTKQLRGWHVAFSPFHYQALAEHALGAKDWGFFNIKKSGWMEQGRQLRKDKQFMMDAARSGLVVHEKAENITAPGKGQLSFIIDRLPEKVKGGVTEKTLNTMNNYTKHLFEQYHPNLKVTTWRDFVDKEVGKRIKKGEAPSEQEIKKIKQDAADVVNNIYGGQEWQLPGNGPWDRKTLGRILGYPDWNVSTIKNAADAFSPGFKGRLSRKYWIKYGIAQVGMTYLMRLAYSGLKQTDPSKSPAGIRFDPQQAAKALKEGIEDPTKWGQFPLPDVPVNIGGYEFNPGRDEKGRRLYSHTGKQWRELYRWRHFVAELFSKLNPVAQTTWNQIMEITPGEKEWYPVEGEYVGRKKLPWGGTEELTPGRMLSRGKKLAKDVLLPYAASSAMEHGAASYLTAGAGALPISKGMSLDASGPYIKEALKAKDFKELNRLRRVLVDNGYQNKQIKSKITEMRNVIKKGY